MGSTTLLRIAGGVILLGLSSYTANGSTIYSIETIDFPGGLNPTIYAINDSGQVTGNYLDATFTSRSFLRSADGLTYTEIAVPGAFVTVPYGLNNAGEVVGSYVAPPFQGFIRSAGGSITTVSGLPGTSQYLNGINNTGIIAGSYDGDSRHGFLVAADGTGFTAFDPPDSILTSATGINNSGQAVGYYFTAADSYVHSFLRSADGSTFLEIDPTFALDSTAVWGINDLGQTVGSSYAGPQWEGASWSFIRNADGTIVPFAVPGASATYLRSINNLGQLAGYYTTTSELGVVTQHGFIATPAASSEVPEPGAFTLISSGLLGLVLLARKRAR